jgi:hypothetical protein
MNAKAGQIWEIKEHIRIAKHFMFSHVFITKIEENKKTGDVVYYDILGPLHELQYRETNSYLSWLIANCELVSE